MPRTRSLLGYESMAWLNRAGQSQRRSFRSASFTFFFGASLFLGVRWASSPAARAADEPPALPQRGSIAWSDDFEAETPTWKFVGGEEFPGAKGAFGRDLSRSRGGKGAGRLDADFRGGGAYVGIWKDLAPLHLPEVESFRFWVQTHNLDRLGIRLVDATGQCHQSNIPLPTAAQPGWREVVLKVRDLVGGEHWGGSNDGQWHGSPQGLGLNIGKNAVGSSPALQGSLWIDDLGAELAPTGTPTLRSCSLTPDRARPGFGTRILLTWDAEPLGTDCSVFVHFVAPERGMVFQADHAPAFPPAGGRGGSSTAGPP